MAGSEIAKIRETIAREYMAAKWGLAGFAQGSAKHEFISARMERIEEGRKALEAYVGGEAIALVAETLDTVPEKPTRDHMQEMLRHEFGDTEDTEYLLNDLKDAWKTFDLLIACFGMEEAQKMINASPSS
jgi:hypothetical protein